MGSRLHDPSIADHSQLRLDLPPPIKLRFGSLRSAFTDPVSEAKGSENRARQALHWQVESSALLRLFAFEAFGHRRGLLMEG